MKRSQELLTGAGFMTLAAAVIAIGQASGGEAGEGRPVAVSRNLHSDLLHTDSNNPNIGGISTSTCSENPETSLGFSVLAGNNDVSRPYYLGMSPDSSHEAFGKRNFDAVVVARFSGSFVEIVTQDDLIGASTVVAPRIGEFATIVSDSQGHDIRVEVGIIPDTGAQIVTLTCATDR